MIKLEYLYLQKQNYVNMIKKTLKILGLALLLLLFVLVIKTVLYSSNQLTAEPVERVKIEESSVSNLSRAISFKTVSNADYTLTDTSEFAAFHSFLDSTYPFIFKNLGKEVHHNFALLYFWKGSNSMLKPLVLLAHQDVVPVVGENWENDPFSGKNDGTYIWGRGTLDDKGSLISILEAVEKLLEEGFSPERDIYLAFGDDEEINGTGARSLAAVLKQRGVEAEMILDEGMVITTGVVPMISNPVALIGTSEKGYLSVEVKSSYGGGHSSMPGPETAISILANAIVKISENRPAPTFTDPVDGFLNYIGPEIPWPARVVFANRWLLGGVLKGIYTGSGPGNATVRTTTAPTMLNAGIKDNVLPAEASAIVNFRLLPGDTPEKMVGYLIKVIGDDRVSVNPVGSAKDAARVSPVDSKAFERLNKTIRECFENTYVAPTLMLASSDSYYYSEISPCVYRFAPYRLNSEDLDRLHGDNERITIENFTEMINFYYRVITNFHNEL
jgi:carboxypeptidase PM20D1